MKQDFKVPEVEDQSNYMLTRSSQVMLAVKQFLEPITVAHFRELHDNPDAEEVSFEFSQLNIYLKAYKPDDTVDKDLWRLPLPGAWTVCIADQLIRS